MIDFIKDKLLGKVPKGTKRSSLWRECRNRYIRRFPKCAACGGTKKLEVHHIVPFHQDPSIELDHTNLITLCRRKKYGISCHILIGHKGTWKDINPGVRGMAKDINVYLKDRKN